MLKVYYGRSKKCGSCFKNDFDLIQQKLNLILEKAGVLFDTGGKAKDDQVLDSKDLDNDKYTQTPSFIRVSAILRADYSAYIEKYGIPEDGDWDEEKLLEFSHLIA